MTPETFYAIAIWSIVGGALAGIINTGLQYYDIIWCRTHDCGNKNKRKKPDNDS